MAVSERFKREVERELQRLQKQGRTTEASEARLLIEKVSAIVADTQRLESRTDSVSSQIKRANIDPDDKQLAQKAIWNAGDKLALAVLQLRAAVGFLQKAEQNPL